ncbi:glycosyltransferase [Flavobacterium sp. F-65]|uniref:Glycosyltransferase n=1 Tax=Flavobacterium pisciphilum TaxID=2893755 RepID=A0ABS8MSF7_9FLAO|nr:glycosyltransferase [Flavobacterium sp. F-65]MCC9071704.1 glycosyltransferase [Flavobacterium sp. F-65]
MTHLISIIIPTYNRAGLIIETLASITAQSYTNWECIIVDDGSNDSTTEIVSAYISTDNRFKLYNRPQYLTKGPNACRNFGFEKSKGYYIYWFDSDDLLFENSIANRVENFEEEFDAVVARADFFDTDTGDKIFENKILSNNIIEDYFTGKITYYVSGPMWRRTFLEKQIELFDEKIRYLDDWDFNLRMIYQNPKIKFLEGTSFRYRSHPFSLSKQVGYLNIEELKSECIARNKHLNLLLKHNIKNSKIEHFVLSRYKVIMRDILIDRNKSSFYFFKILFLTQLRFKDFKGLAKTCIGFPVYYFFNKGYILIK